MGCPNGGHACPPYRLPPPRETPLDRSTGSFSRLSPLERWVADGVLGEADVFVLVRTAGTADVGTWLRRGRLWAAALGDELVLFAAGRKPYSERAGFTELTESVYNQVTGQLVLARYASAM